jgi:outer membrane protein OmpA-like peptidoglycan-associated protein
MKIKSSYFSLMLFLIAVTGAPLGAQECEDTQKMLNWAKGKPPAAMTEQIFRSALEKCPENTAYYRQIAEYYKHWYENELNVEKQIEYKQHAIAYYEKALAGSKGKARSEIKTEIAGLQRQDSFSKLAMRRLRPSSQGASGTGISLKVLFKLDDYNLTDRAQEHLDILGEYMLENRSTQISLEGHTDRHGEPGYNLDLSRKRAESAKAFLVKKYNIQSDRILTMGHGYERLADPTKPYDSVNRRVEVIKIIE